MLNEIALVGYIDSKISISCDEGKLFARFKLETHDFRMQKHVMSDEISMHSIVCVGRYATELSVLNPIKGTMLSVRGRVKTHPIQCKECALPQSTEIWVERMEDSLKAGSSPRQQSYEKRAI